MKVNNIVKKLLEGENVRDVLVEASKRVKKWSGKVKTKWSPPAGLFTKSAQTIANVLASASKDLKQAISRINFYINRAGENLSAKRKAELEKAKDLLRKKFSAQSVAAGLSPEDYDLDNLTENEIKELEDEFRDYQEDE